MIEDRDALLGHYRERGTRCSPPSTVSATRR